MTNKEALNKTIEFYEEVIPEVERGNKGAFCNSKWGSHNFCSFCTVNLSSEYFSPSCGECPLQNMDGLGDNKRCVTKTFKQLVVVLNRSWFSYCQTESERTREHLAEILKDRYMEILWACKDIL